MTRALCGYPLSVRTAARRCPECGAEQPDDAATCSVCGFPMAEMTSPLPPQSAPKPAAPVRKQGALTGFLNALTGENLKKTYITLWEMVKAGTKKYNYEERTEKMDRIFVCGTPDTTPRLCDIRTDKIVVWAVWYVLLAFYIATFGMEFGYYILQNRLFIPGMIVYGAFGVPFSCLLLFCEINLFRSIPFYRVLVYFFSGAFLSLFVALIGFTLIPQAGAGDLLSSLLVGVIEETAKGIITIVFIIREKRCRYILDGLLIGAAVGASFGAFETMGYILVYGLMESSRTGFTIDYILVLRGLLAPGMHVAWSALIGGAFMVVRGFGAKSEWSHVASPKFLLPFVTSVVIHGVWDTDLPLPMIIKNGLLTAVIWTILLYYINLGLKQLEEAKKRAGTVQK